MDNLSDKERGTGFGLVQTIYMLIGSAGSVTTGFLVDTVGRVVAYGLTILLLLFAVLSLVVDRLFRLQL